jgi:hypothetical protein
MAQYHGEGTSTVEVYWKQDAVYKRKHRCHPSIDRVISPKSKCFHDNRSDAAVIHQQTGNPRSMMDYVHGDDSTKADEKV